MKKNKYSTPLWMLATILAGMLSPMQSAVNGQLGHWLTTETALLSCIKQAREDVLTLRHLQLLHQNR